MLKNNFRLTLLFGIWILATSCGLLGIGVQLIEEYNETGDTGQSFWIGMLFLSGGIIGFILAIALVNRQRWARNVLNVVFILSILGWTLVLLSILKNIEQDIIIIIISISVFVYGMQIYCILLLNNNVMLKELGEALPEEEYSNILDR